VEELVNARSETGLHVYRLPSQWLQARKGLGAKSVAGINAIAAITANEIRPCLKPVVCPPRKMRYLRKRKQNRISDANSTKSSGYGE
jgi:hypothetical protein|tara:strand:- start:916 stop:1176 length:261 start_codon:yes stop_codon:yes gene_type:complete